MSVPHSADRGETVHTNLPVADRRMLHFLLDTLTSALTCLLELGLRNRVLSLGKDYERITLQCHTKTPVLAVLKWAGWSQNIVDQIKHPFLHTPYLSQRCKHPNRL